MIAFGERLRRAREEAGVSLTEISARTKIRVSVLEAIERADLARLPAAFYTKAFLRAYGAQVHLDAGPLVEEYVALSEIPPPAAPQLESPPQQDVVPAMAELFELLRPGLAPAAMCILAGILFFFAFKLSQADRPSPVPQEEAGAIATSGTAPSQPAPVTTAAAEQAPLAPVTTAVAEKSSAIVPLQPDPLTMDVRASGLLWLEGTADGKLVVRRLLQPHETIVVNARDEIRLLIGDAAAFDYAIEGRPGRRLGGPGQVRTIDVTRTNYGQFVSTPNSSP